MRLRKRARQNDSGVQGDSRKLQKGMPTKTNLPNTSRASKCQNSVSNSFQKYKLPTKKLWTEISRTLLQQPCQNPPENVQVGQEG